MQCVISCAWPPQIFGITPPYYQSLFIVLQSFDLDVWDYGPDGGRLPSGLEKVERSADKLDAAFCGLAGKGRETRACAFLGGLVLGLRFRPHYIK